MYGIFRDLMYKVPARALQESVGDRVSNFFNGTQAINTGSCSCHFASARKDRLKKVCFEKTRRRVFFSASIAGAELSFLQAIQFLQQIQCERGARPVEFEVADEAQGTLRPYDRVAVKLPLVAGRCRFDDTVVHHLDNQFCPYPTGVAEFPESKRNLLVEDDTPQTA
jgi:hypothetical protein